MLGQIRHAKKLGYELHSLIGIDGGVKTSSSQQRPTIIATPVKRRETQWTGDWLLPTPPPTPPVSQNGQLQHHVPRAVAAKKGGHCTNCDKPGHLAAVCRGGAPKKPDPSPNRRGPKTPDTPTNRRGPKKPDTPKTANSKACHNCGKPGHFAADCRGQKKPDTTSNQKKRSGQNTPRTASGPNTPRTEPRDKTKRRGSRAKQQSASG